MRADDAAAATAWTPAAGTAGDTSVGVLSGDPRHSAAIRDAITAGLRSGTIAARHHRSRLTGVALVGGGPGDPGLITVRGRQLLAEADVVIADRLGPRELLAELSPDVIVIDAGKVPYRRQMSQDEINEALISQATSGKFVVRLKGGDPFVFGRGGEMLACLRVACRDWCPAQQRDRRADRGGPAGRPPGDRAGLSRHLGACATLWGAVDVPGAGVEEQLGDIGEELRSGVVDDGFEEAMLRSSERFCGNGSGAGSRRR